MLGIGLTMTRHYFAIGFKNWVELRVASVPPKKEDSTAKRTIEYEETGFDPKGKMTKIQVKKPVTIKACYYSGGKVVGVYPNTTFYHLTGINVLDGQMSSVGPKLVTLLKDWSKRHGGV